MMPSGIRYDCQFWGGDDDTDSSTKLSKSISNRIYSNEDLAFARAFLAYVPFKSSGSLSEKQPRVIARYHPAHEVGSDFRKVTIIIYAKNLFKGLSEKLNKKK